MLKLSPAVRRRLADHVDGEVGKALAGRCGMAAPMDLREAVGATVSAGLPAAADAWANVLAPLGLTVNVISAFSFGAPLVEFTTDGTSRRCRISDLMVVVDDLTGPSPDRRAMLLKTRLAAANDGDPGPAERQLYERWPPFRFTDASYANGDRVFQAAQTPATARHGGLAEIDLSPSSRGWVVLPPDAMASVGARDSLGRWLLDLATGGGTIAARGGGDDWSRTVDELLSRTANATMWGLGPNPRFRSVATYKGRLGSGFVVFENTGELQMQSALLDGAAAPDMGSLVEGPLSIVHIIFGPAEQAGSRSASVLATHHPTIAP